MAEANTHTHIHPYQTYSTTKPYARGGERPVCEIIGLARQRHSEVGFKTQSI